MGSKSRSHTSVGNAHFCLMVGCVTIEMFHVVGSTWSFKLLCCRYIVIFVIDKFKIVETTLITPEIRILITSNHHSTFTTCVDIGTALRALPLYQTRIFTCAVNHDDTESFHQVGRRATPASPHRTNLTHTFNTEVRLQCVLASPVCTNCPTPSNQAFRASVVGTTEDVFIVVHEFATRIVDNVFCIVGSFLQVFVVERTTHTSLGQINL